MRTTIFTLAAIAGSALAGDNPNNFNRDTAPTSSVANAVTQIGDGEHTSRSRQLAHTH